MAQSIFARTGMLCLALGFTIGFGHDASAQYATGGVTAQPTYKPPTALSPKCMAISKDINDMKADIAFLDGYDNKWVSVAQAKNCPVPLGAGSIVTGYSPGDWLTCKAMPVPAVPAGGVTAALSCTALNSAISTIGTKLGCDRRYLVAAEKAKLAACAVQ